MSTSVVNLSGKVALITGATSGIGRAVALLFSKLGASVIITGRSSERLAELSNEISSNGDEAFAYPADLCKEEDIRSLVQAVTDRYKNVDILVNNAGILEAGTIENTSLEQFDRIMNVNVRSLFYLTHLLVPQLTKSSSGCVVNVSSVNGIRSFPGVLAYCVSKAAVDQFTRCVALELAPKGVRVNSVNPGVVRTEIHLRSGMDETAYQAFLAHSQSTHAMGRIGQPEEVANAIAFLASDAASFITGVSIPVDGGVAVQGNGHHTTHEDTSMDFSIDGTSSSYVTVDQLVSADEEPPRQQAGSRPTRSSARLASNKLLSKNNSGGRPRYSPSVVEKCAPRTEQAYELPVLRSRLNQSNLKANAGKVKQSHGEDAKPFIQAKSPVKEDVLEEASYYQSNIDTLSKVTDGPIFCPKFIGTLADLPLSLLLHNDASEMDNITVADHVPHVKLCDEPCAFSFIVDTSEINVNEICIDGLDPWNLRGGARLSLTKFYFDENMGKCGVEEHVTCVQRRAYCHPRCIPPGSVKKIVWLVTKRKEISRYALITYNIQENAVIEESNRVGREIAADKIHLADLTDQPVRRSLRRNRSLRHPSGENQVQIADDDYLFEDLDDAEFIIERGADLGSHRSCSYIPRLSAEYLEQLTAAPAYKQTFMNSVRDLPLDLLLQEFLDESISVCTFVPHLNLFGVPAALSFIVDTTRVPFCDLSSDNLGQWNARDGQRMSVRKFFYKGKSKCAEGEHDYCVIRRKYTHPHCLPLNSVRKIIWLIKKERFCRYAVISYLIEPGAQVALVPHGNSKVNERAYVRTRPSLVKKRKSKPKQKYGPWSAQRMYRGHEEDVLSFSSNDANSDVNVDGSVDENVISLYPELNISEGQAHERIAKMTSAAVYSCKYVNAIGHVPIDLLRGQETSVDSVEVNVSVPQITLSGKAAHMSFIVECSQIPIAELANDGLGSWNTKQGKRVSVFKFFYNKENMKCLEGNHEYYVLRKKYVHPYANPPNSIRKVVWIARRFDKTYYRYVLITYRIQENATVEKHVKNPHRAYQPLPPMEPIDEDLVNKEIERITESRVYLTRFVNNIHELPIDLLSTSWNLEEPVCTSVPFINILHEPTKVALQISFIVDTSKVAVLDLSTDNLGQWNTSHGRRMTLRKFFFNRERRRCARGNHSFTVTRKTYVHPHSLPEGSVRKIIWQISNEYGFTRYALITFDIGCGAVVKAVPHGNSKTNTAVYIRREPSVTFAERKSSRKKDNLRRIAYPNSPPRLKRSRFGTPSSISLYNEENIETMDATFIDHEELIMRMSRQSTRHYSEPFHNDEPFNLVFLVDQNVGLIQCASCGVSFSRHAHPPEDIVLEHIERFWNQRTGCFSLQQMQKRYIHARLDCVLSRYDYFTTRDFLAIANHVRTRLNETHQQYLSDEFGCVII